MLEADYLRSVFDAVPSPAFVVDRDVRILDANRAASLFMGDQPEKFLRQRAGDVLRCLQAAEAPNGCGTGEACTDCLVRNSVKQAMDGYEAVRQRTAMQLVEGNGISELHLLVTASPFRYEGARYVLLIMEDITELTLLRHILPICSACKKIRNDEDYWEQVESYMSKRIDVSFSHSLCPECAQRLYPFLNDEKQTE